MTGAAGRFYKEVSVAGEDGGFSVRLDGRPIKTPAGAAFLLPNRTLAEAVAEEWRAREAKIAPDTMLLTKLSHTAIDRVRAERARAVDQVLAFAKSDALCYRAQTPQSLVRRQTQVWDPLLQWAAAEHGATLTCTAGIGFVEQPPEALAALERALASHDDFALAGLHSAAALTGSAVIALALIAGRLTHAEAFAAAHLDEIYQAETWGQDAEAVSVSRRKAAELAETARFFALLRS